MIQTTNGFGAGVLGLCVLLSYWRKINRPKPKDFISFFFSIVFVVVM